MTETLDEYLRGFAHGDPVCGAVAATVAAAARGAVGLAALAMQGALAGRMAKMVGQSAGGDEQKALDLRAHNIFLRAFQDAPVAMLASEEADEPIQLSPGAPLAVAIDPLDGSKNIDVNAPLGSIFAILPAQDVPWHKLFLQPGSALLGAGFTLHGPHTVLVLALGTGVNVFTLDPVQGRFLLTLRNLRLPAGVREYAINASNSRHWDAPIRTYIDDCVAGADGPRGSDFNMRWIGCRSPRCSASCRAEASTSIRRRGAGYSQRPPAPDLRGQPDRVDRRAGGRRSDRRQRARAGDHARHLHQRVPLVFGARGRWSASRGMHGGLHPRRTLAAVRAARLVAVLGGEAHVGSHPIISVTGSSGAGTTSVRQTFERFSAASRSPLPSSRATPSTASIAPAWSERWRRRRAW